MNSRYQLDKPYPQPQGLAANRRTGLTLLQCYCGQHSEFTAFSQYVCHATKCAVEQPALAEMLRCIAETELIHLNLLGACINALGVNPKLRTISNNGRKYWTGRNITYVESYREILRANLESEKAQIQQYEAAMKRLTNTQISAMIARIIEDERFHMSILTEFYNKYF